MQPETGRQGVQHLYLHHADSFIAWTGCITTSLQCTAVWKIGTQISHVCAKNFFSLLHPLIHRQLPQLKNLPCCNFEEDVVKVRGKPQPQHNYSFQQHSTQNTQKDHGFRPSILPGNAQSFITSFHGDLLPQQLRCSKTSTATKDLPATQESAGSGRENNWQKQDDWRYIKQPYPT